MTVKVALSYASFYGRTFEDALRGAHDQGFDAVQLTPDQTPNLTEELTTSRREAIRKLAASYGLSVSLHNVFYDINLMSVVPAVADGALQITKDVFRLARDLSADEVVVHPGYMFPGWRRDQWQRELFWANAQVSLGRLCNAAMAFGVRVLFENGSYCLTTMDQSPRVPLHVAITPLELKQVLDLTQRRANVCLDVNKALRSGFALTEFVDAAGAELRQLQMSTVSDHWREIEPMLNRVIARGFDGTIVLEGSRRETENAFQLLRSFFGRG